MLYAHVAAGQVEGPVRRSLFLPLIAALSACCAYFGMIQLRIGFLGKETRICWADLAFIPHFFAAAVALGGFGLVSVLVFNICLGGYLLLSGFLGSELPRFVRSRNIIVGIGFLMALSGTLPATLAGSLAPEMMATSVALVTYTTYLLSNCNRLAQRARLSAQS